MGCAAILKETGKQCPKEVVKHDVCADHLVWRRRTKWQLGFNLIVKNEARHLARCLQSIRDIADEIVVTDTGSTDDTVNVALQYADKVLFHAWQNSFSEARNWGLQFSTTDWICWIDGDESLMPDSVELVQRVLANDNGAMALFCALLSELPDGRVSKHYLPKFFRRGTAHFEAIVHNQLIHASPVMQTEIRFWHTGYNQSEAVMNAKRDRTANLLQKQLEANPDDTFAIMNLARTLLTRGKYQESIDLAERGLALPSATQSLKQMLLYNQAICAMNLDDDEKAERACWEALKEYPDNVDMMFILGWMNCVREKYEKAIVYLNRYFQLRDEQEDNGFNLLILDFWDAQPQTYNFLGHAYRKLGHWDKSIRCLKRAVAMDGYNVSYWKALAVSYLEAGKHEMIKQILGEVTNRGIADNEVWKELSANPV